MAQANGTSSGLLLQVGPMLKYDTVIEGIYRIFALVSVDDAHSDPSLAPEIVWSVGAHAATAPTPDAQVARSKQLFHYEGQAGQVTFYRFLLEVPMGQEQSYCTYQVSPGRIQPKPDQKPDSVDPSRAYTFVVPGLQQSFHWAAHSCNGFSLSANPDDFDGPSPLWEDMLRSHAEQPFHIMNGGGDQIYCDRMVNEPELKAWHSSKNPKERAAMPLTDEIKVGLDRFWIQWYTEWFSTGAFSRAIAQIPMTNMLDDHDLIDGWGTYPDEWSLTPIFNHIGTKGYWWYLLFQQFLVDEVDGTDETTHPNKSIIFGAVDSPYARGFKGHTFLTYLGPEQYLLMLDCRAERKINQIVTEATYDKVLAQVYRLPATVKHLVVLLGVPLAYPRMVFAEKILGGLYAPLLRLVQSVNPGFTNDFDGRPELLDDLGDHWCAAPHKKERNWLVGRLQDLAASRGVRISFVSGDVHAGGCGVFLDQKKVDPKKDPKYMLAMITSAIVNTPPPNALIKILNFLAKKTHHALLYSGTKETMIKMFGEGLDGQASKQKYIIGSRNWCNVQLNPEGSLVFELRVEKVRGGGETKAYTVQTPAPAWQPTESKFDPKRTEHHPHMAKVVSHLESTRAHATGTAHPQANLDVGH